MPNQRHPDKRVYNYWTHKNIKERITKCASQYDISANELIDICVEATLPDLEKNAPNFTQREAILSKLKKSNN